MSLDIDVSFNEILAKAQAAFDDLSPAEQRAHRREQAISFAYGNTRLHNPDVTLEMVESAWIAQHPCPIPPEGWRCTRGADHGGPCAAIPDEDELGLRAALVFLQREDGGILCVWNRKHGCWGLPGGKQECDEPLYRTATRELLEETGLAIYFAPLATILDVSPTFSGSGRLCTVFHYDALNIEQAHASELGGGVGWMTKEFLCSEPKTGEWFRGFFERTGL